MIPYAVWGFSDPVSSWSHLLAACAALVGTVVLWSKGRGNSARLTALMLFSFALVFLFSMSGVFHLLPRGSVARDVLQRLDHAGIWVLIAATFGPIHVILFRDYKRWGILLGVWIVAITALVLEIVFFNEVSEALLVSLFLGLGWVGAITGYFFKKLYGDPSIWLFAAGGIFYSVGAVIDVAGVPTLVNGVVGPHEIFHLFIVAGALSHWMFIYHWSHHPVHNTITFHVFVRPDRVNAKALGEKMEIEAPTLDEAKLLIRERLKDKYHSTINPVVRLIYYNEEQLL